VTLEGNEDTLMEEVQAAYLRHLAAVSESRDLDGAFAVRTGIASNSENGVVSSVPHLDPGAIRELLEWLDEVPSSWIALDPAIGSSLRAAGCRPETESWYMDARIEQLARPTHGVERVTSADELDEWLSIVRDADWFDDVEPARRLYTALGYEGLYLAEDGAGSAFFLPPVVLLNSVAVRPHAQRRGIGRSLALARLRDARERGCTRAILSPSPDGQKLYASLGFRTRPQPPGRWFYLPG
jgi:GNAT superfamily N-acetyltransferase